MHKSKWERERESALKLRYRPPCFTFGNSLGIPVPPSASHSSPPSHSLACVSFGVSFVVIYAEPCGSAIPRTPWGHANHICMLQLHVCVCVCVCSSWAQIKSKAKWIRRSSRRRENTRNNNKHAGRTFLLLESALNWYKKLCFWFLLRCQTYDVTTERDGSRDSSVREREREREEERAGQLQRGFCMRWDYF